MKAQAYHSNGRRLVVEQNPARIARPEFQVANSSEPCCCRLARQRGNSRSHRDRRCRFRRTDWVADQQTRRRTDDQCLTDRRGRGHGG